MPSLSEHADSNMEQHLITMYERWNIMPTILLDHQRKLYIIHNDLYPIS